MTPYLKLVPKLALIGGLILLVVGLAYNHGTAAIAGAILAGAGVIATAINRD